ncbi:ATPase [Gangjinia marincola]|uniref:ATPase n=1 Tax=Gangjinia marincola TaxID=578463 RepID=A0ABN1MHW6_9FLAO
MTNYEKLCSKLESFIRKYYTNQLIKGAIFFVGLGLIYVVVSLILEYYLWLGTLGRSILFWSFIVLVVFLLIRFIVIPLSKLFKLAQGINYEEASHIIGNYFHEVDDKLLNVLQLNNQHKDSDLLLASIDQKSAELQPIPFGLAINFKRNLTYVKYATIPVLVFFAVWASGNGSIFSESYERVVNYDKAYLPPAPFQFFVINNSLRVHENNSLTLKVKTEGEYIPQDVKIYFNDQEYYLKSSESSTLYFTFENITEDLTFYLAANEVRSQLYTIKVIQVPALLNFEMILDYPKYTLKKDEIISSTGTVTIPEGTVINWKLNTKSTSNVDFVTSDTVHAFEQKNTIFTYRRSIRNSLGYELITSNDEVKNYERLAYQLKVIKDLSPTIRIETKLDSTDSQSVYIKGEVSDDYGLKKTRIVYYPQENELNRKVSEIKTGKGTVDQFLFIFPGGLDVEEGVAYEYYFEVFDNDQVNGSKSTRSGTNGFRKNTKEEKQREQLQKQQKNIEALDQNIKNKEAFQKELYQINQEQKEKTSLNYNDQQKLKDFLKRQQMAEQLMKNYTKELKENLSVFRNDEEKIDPRNKDLQERLERNESKLEENEKLLEELQKYQDKIDKEELNRKLEDLAKRNKNQKRNLEQLLELTKQYYVEQKAEKITEDLQKLAEKQEQLAKKNQDDNTSEKQEELNEKFNELQKDLNELQKENNELNKPIALDRDKGKEEAVKNDQNEAKENLETKEQEEEGKQEEEEGQEDNKEEGNPSNEEQDSPQDSPNSPFQKARQKQKSAAKKMKEMSAQMAMNMQSSSQEGESEDAEMLRQILDNLVVFSVEQEDLMNSFKALDRGNPSFSKKLRQQYILKENFIHVDDSLYALALRNPRITEKITEKLTDIVFDLDKALERLAENQLNQGTASQQYVVTGANDLAYMLSKALEDMQSGGSGSGSGSGKGKGKGRGFQLSDIIQKQEDLGEKAKSAQRKAGEGQGKSGKQGDNEESGKGKKGDNGENSENGKDAKGNGKREGNGNKDSQDGLNNAELYEIYKQQQQLRNDLENRLQKEGLDGKARNLLESMKDAENELINNGLTNSVIQKLDALKHQLLKLEQAAYQQGQKEERNSSTSTKVFTNDVEQIQKAKEYFNLIEILDREALPLRPNFKEKVQTYFKSKND